MRIVRQPLAAHTPLDADVVLAQHRGGAQRARRDEPGGEADVVVRVAQAGDALDRAARIKAPAPRAVAHERDEAAARDRGRALAERKDEQGVVARADAQRDRVARKLGLPPRRPRAWAGTAGVVGAGADPSATMRRTGPVVQSAGLPTCQNHSPAARPAGALNSTRVTSPGDGAPSRRPPSSAMAPQPSTAAGDRATRTTSAPAPRAVKVSRRSRLHLHAVGRGHRRRRVRLRAGRRGEHDDGRERGRGKAQGREHRRPR